MWATLALSIAKFMGSAGFASLVEGYKAKLAAGNTAEKIAADFAAKELDLEQQEREIAAKQLDVLRDESLEGGLNASVRSPWDTLMHSPPK